MKSKQRLFNQALNHIGKNWSKSSLTREKLINNIRHIATFMAAQGLQHIRHMKGKHVDRFIDDLKSKGLAPSTMQNYATALRLLAKNIGKPGIVPGKNSELGITRYSGPGFLGHEKEVNIVFKEIAYGKGCTVLRCSGRRA